MNGVKAFADAVNYTSRNFVDPSLTSLYVHDDNMLQCDQTADSPTSFGDQFEVKPSKSVVKTGGNNAEESVRTFNKAPGTSTTEASFVGEGCASSRRHFPTIGKR
jgi:hypothetical protein